MSGEMAQAIFTRCYENQRFRKPRGEVVFKAERLWIDRSLEQYYNFVHVYVRVRNENTGRTELIRWEEFKNNWIRVDPVDDLEQRREDAIDSVLGIPWYRQNVTLNK
jgi:hypothetical protein